MIGKESVREGMIVRSSDGEKLGKVLSLGNREFLIEKGVFFRKDYVIPYESIRDFRDGDLILAIARENLREVGEEAPAAREGAGIGEQTRGMSAAEGEEVRVPLRAEELEIDKRRREAGRVEVRKEVVTEQQQVTVPVERERVTVERVPAERASAASEAGPREEGVSIPLHEEEVEVRKRPVVREELRIRKEREMGEQRVAETVRREEADVKRSGDVRGPLDEKDKEPTRH